MIRDGAAHLLHGWFGAVLHFGVALGLRGHVNVGGDHILDEVAGLAVLLELIV